MAQVIQDVKPRIKIKSSSMSQVTTPIIEPDKPRVPSVWFSDKAWCKLWYAVDICAKEVGWFGLVDKTEDGDYVIDDIFVPEQTVSSAETHIEAEALGELANDLEADGVDSSRLRYWGHSHVNMGVSPSKTDEDQIADYLDHVDYFIRGIHNKKQDSKVDVYDVSQNLIFQRVPTGRIPFMLSYEELSAFHTMITANVTERTYQRPAPYHHTYNNRGNRSGGYYSNGVWVPYNGRVDDRLDANGDWKNDKQQQLEVAEAAIDNAYDTELLRDRQLQEQFADPFFVDTETFGRI